MGLSWGKALTSEGFGAVPVPGPESETFPAVERYPHPIAHLPVVESTTGVIMVAGLICDSKTFTA
jgi:hypothetical protein